MPQEHIPHMAAGVKASVAGGGGVLAGSWLATYEAEIGAVCMIISACCAIAGLVYTLYKGKKGGD